MIALYCKLEYCVFDVQAVTCTFSFCGDIICAAGYFNKVVAIHKAEGEEKGMESLWHSTVKIAGRIAGGETGNTTAKITSQHGMCYQKLIRTLGKKKAIFT